MSPVLKMWRIIFRRGVGRKGQPFKTALSEPGTLPFSEEQSLATSNSLIGKMAGEERKQFNKETNLARRGKKNNNNEEVLVKQHIQTLRCQQRWDPTRSKYLLCLSRRDPVRLLLYLVEGRKRWRKEEEKLLGRNKIGPVESAERIPQVAGGCFNKSSLGSSWKQKEMEADVFNGMFIGGRPYH